jgi:hypothetical protein
MERRKWTFLALGPYSETCSNLPRRKLLQKSSVSKFVRSFAKWFFVIKMLLISFLMKNYNISKQKLLFNRKNVEIADISDRKFAPD